MGSEYRRGDVVVYRSGLLWWVLSVLFNRQPELIGGKGWKAGIVVEDGDLDEVAIVTTSRFGKLVERRLRLVAGRPGLIYRRSYGRPVPPDNEYTADRKRNLHCTPRAAASKATLMLGSVLTTAVDASPWFVRWCHSRRPAVRVAGISIETLEQYLSDQALWYPLQPYGRVACYAPAD